MRKGLFLLGIIGLSVCLSGCYEAVCNDDVVDYSPPPPCLIPNILPNDAMGNLGIRIIRIGDSVRIILPSDNIFMINSGQIRESALPGLNLLAVRIHEYYGTVPMTITAYTDDLALPSENKLTAEAQAVSIETFLWTHGYPHQLLTPVGVGEDYSGTVASNRSIIGSAANRRVEITLRTR